ncbi:MAG TPA: hypothetical protein VFW44_13345, partial [Bryobacteraceae bacterium]|nr:hypothetical protein [Bryobacteraceae bacterium]
MATFSMPSTQSLIVVLGLLMVWIALVVSESFHIVPTGLRVHLVRPGIRFASNAGIQPLLIYVARDPHGNGSLF